VARLTHIWLLVLKPFLLVFVAASLVVGISAVPAQAGTIDLTTAGTSGLLDGLTGGNAWFVQGGEIVSGTGVFPSFVQVKAHGSNTTEAAYNTTVNDVLDNGGSDEHNHAITMSELPIVLKDDEKYYEFLLDINENDNTAGRYLSLNDLVIKTSTTANQAAATIGALAGTTRWDMAPGDQVLLNYDLVSSGSGRPDMTFLVRVSDFAGALPTDYVYLYSQFGLTPTLTGLSSKGKTVLLRDYGASANFEEWAMGHATFFASVPDGGTTLMLLGAAIGGLGLVRRRFDA